MKPPNPRKKAVQPRKKQAAPKPPRQPVSAAMGQWRSYVAQTAQVLGPPQDTSIQHKSAPVLAPPFLNNAPNYFDPNAAMNAHYFNSAVQHAQMPIQQQEMSKAGYVPIIQAQKWAAAQVQNQEREQATLSQQGQGAQPACASVQLSANGRTRDGVQHGVQQGFAQDVPLQTQDGMVNRMVHRKAQGAGAGVNPERTNQNVNQSPHISAHKRHQTQLKSSAQLTLTEEQMRGLNSEQIRRILIIANERNIQVGQDVSPVLAEQAEQEPKTSHVQQMGISIREPTDVAVNSPAPIHHGLQHSKQAADLMNTKRLSNATQFRCDAQVISPVSHGVNGPHQEMNTVSYGQGQQSFAGTSMLPSNVTIQYQMQAPGQNTTRMQFRKPSDRRGTMQLTQNVNPPRNTSEAQNEGESETCKRGGAHNSSLSSHGTTGTQAPSGTVNPKTERLIRPVADPRSQINSDEIVKTNEYRTATTLVQLQKRYKPALQKFMPVIQRMVERYPLKQRNRFSEHLRNCCSILTISIKLSGEGKIEFSTPNCPTRSMLARVDAFLLQLMRTTAKALRYRRNRVQKPNLMKRHSAHFLKPAPVIGGMHQSSFQPTPSEVPGEISSRQISQRIPGNHPSSQKCDFAAQKAIVAERAPLASHQVGYPSFIEKKQVSQTQNSQQLPQPRTPAILHKSFIPLQQKLTPQTISRSNSVPVSAPPRPAADLDRTPQMRQIPTPVQKGTSYQQSWMASKLQEGSQHFQSSGKHQSFTKVVQPISEGNQASKGPSATKKFPAGLTHSATNTNTTLQGNVVKSAPINLNSHQDANGHSGPVTATGKRKSTPECPETSPVPTISLQQKARHVGACVKEALKYSGELEALMQKEMKRMRFERVQSTLSVLWRHKDLKREHARSLEQSELKASPDTDNCNPKGMNGSGRFLERSSEGTHIAKKPRLVRSDIFRAVEADCQAARAKYPSLRPQISEIYGLPVVTCSLESRLMQLPNLVLHVEQGYPQKGIARYGFERPTIGWVGLLGKIRERFQKTLESGEIAVNGVAAVLVAWANAADGVASQASPCCDL